MCTLHDFTCTFLSVKLQDVESTVQDAETKDDPVSLNTYYY